MENKKFLQTQDAPAAIGTYSQGIRVYSTVYLSGQIGLDPSTMQLVEGIDAQIHRIFQNLRAVSIAAGSNLDDLVKLNVYLSDLDNFTRVNEIMMDYFKQPYPARAVIGVADLPRAALVEMDGVLVIPD